MFIVELHTPGGWVKICSENVKENGILALREMWLSSPGIYRLMHGKNVIAVMGVG